MIMAYFEHKGYVQRNLYLNCVLLWEDFEKILYAGSVSSASVVIGGDSGQSASGV